MNAVLFGYGYWGKKLYDVIKQHGQVYIVDPTHADTVSEEWVLRHSGVTHAFIATPEETHFDLALKCLSSGKHTFVEKPLCLYEQEAALLASKAQAAGLVLFVDYTFLYDPHVHHIRQVIQSGELGKPEKVSIIRNSPGINKPAITVFDDLAIHDIYLIRELFGKHPDQVTVSNTVMRDDKVVQADVHYSVGSLEIKAHYSWVAEDNLRELRIMFTDGELFWSRGAGVVVRGKHEHLFPLLDSQDIQSTVRSPLEICTHNFLQLTSSSTNWNSHDYTNDVKVLQNLRESAGC